MKTSHYVILVIVLFLLGSSLGGYGSPEHDQPIRGLGGLLTISAIVIAIYAFVTRKKRKSSRDKESS